MAAKLLELCALPVAVDDQRLLPDDPFARIVALAGKEYAEMAATLVTSLIMYAFAYGLVRFIFLRYDLEADSGYGDTAHYKSVAVSLPVAVLVTTWSQWTMSACDTWAPADQSSDARRQANLLGSIVLLSFVAFLTLIALSTGATRWLALAFVLLYAQSVLHSPSLASMTNGRPLACTDCGNHLYTTLFVPAWSAAAMGIHPASATTVLLSMQIFSWFELFGIIQPPSAPNQEGDARRPSTNWWAFAFIATSCVSAAIVFGALLYFKLDETTMLKFRLRKKAMMAWY